MIKGGLVGLGRMGITHFSILNAHPSVHIAAICDQSHTMLNIWKKYTQVHTYSDYHSMFQEEALDFVVISTPTDSHSEIIKAALNSGLHVFVEKPFALNGEQARETAGYLEGKDLVNQVGYVNRFNEVFVEVKKLLATGLIGDVKAFSSEMYGPTVLKDSKGNWRGKKTSGGGCMYEFASHCIDLVLFFMGPPERVTGSIMQSIYSSDVEDMVSSTFVYGTGCTGTITVNWSDPAFRKPTNIVKFLGAEGKIIADKHAYKVFLKGSSARRAFRPGWNSRYITDFAKPVRFYVRGNEFTRQLDYFVDCIEHQRTGNICDFAEAVKTDVVMNEITRDAVHSIEGGIDAMHESPAKLADKPRSSLWRRIAG
jgi:predicted dehydrogenase